MFTTYIAAAPNDAERALGRGLPLAHMAYTVGENLTLRRSARFTAHGGLMVISNTLPEPDADADAFCRAVLAEYRERNFSGILPDFEVPLPRVLSELERAGAELFVPFGTGITAGALRGQLERAVRNHGAKRLLLDVERIARDITLPSPEGLGVPVSRSELSQLMSARRPAIFFSNELCANYFTYKDARSATHFVLFDDEESIAKKLRLGRELGLHGAILLYSEIMGSKLPAVN
ncbi:hypothetical protein FACS189425_04570 [Clostridia bacterium]|nr:hypothetical protein FACS189425_04570 [Clostridia bacterium]